MPSIEKAERRDRKKRKIREWKPDSGRSVFDIQRIQQKRRDQLIRKQRKEKEKVRNGDD
jgi:hypothetical protein